MKIGFSLGRCVRDIVNGAVAIDDVAFIIAATCIHDREGIDRVISVYINEPGYLLGLDYDQCLLATQQLWDTNRLLQPRRQGLHRHMQPENSVWIDMFPTEQSNNEAVKNAWTNYRFMLHMSENVDTEAMANFK